jgi:hypothetical protein
VLCNIPEDGRFSSTAVEAYNLASKHLCNVYRNVKLNRSWVTRAMASKTRKAELHDLPSSGHWLHKQDKLWY